MTAGAYTPDLLDRSKIAAAAPETRFVSTPEALVGLAVDFVVVDLRQPRVLDVIPNVTVPVIGYGSHVDRDTLDAARAAGCAQVLPRSAFFSRLSEILSGPPS